jgi:hypothetical protein
MKRVLERDLRNVINEASGLTKFQPKSAIIAKNRRSANSKPKRAKVSTSQHRLLFCLGWRRDPREQQW